MTLLAAAAAMTATTTTTTTVAGTTTTTTTVGPIEGAIRATLPSDDLSSHGAGYPLTFVFDVPEVEGLQAQWRAGGGSWTALASPPVGRFDGIDAARIDAGTAYVSKAFEIGTPTLDVRVVDSIGSVVGTFMGIAEGYDDRMPVAFTYDDNPSLSQWTASTGIHQDLKLWMSPGLNCGPESQQGTSMIPDYADGVAGGYVEVSNHTRGHVNAGQLTTQAQADTQYIDNAVIIAGDIGMPPQSRGRVHSCIYPYGEYNDLVFTAAASAGHLTGRVVLLSDEPIELGTYERGIWDDEFGMVTRQQASVCPRNGGVLAPTDPVVIAAECQKVLDAVNYARTNSLPQCIVYSYIRHWTWTTGSPWPLMLAEIAAMADVWSVGYGHLALYQRTRERVSIAAIA